MKRVTRAMRAVALLVSSCTDALLRPAATLATLRASSPSRTVARFTTRARLWVTPDRGATLLTLTSGATAWFRSPAARARIALLGGCRIPAGQHATSARGGNSTSTSTPAACVLGAATVRCQQEHASIAHLGSIALLLGHTHAPPAQQGRTLTGRGHTHVSPALPARYRARAPARAPGARMGGTWTKFPRARTAKGALAAVLADPAPPATPAALSAPAESTHGQKGHLCAQSARLGLTRAKRERPPAGIAAPATPSRMVMRPPAQRVQWDSSAQLEHRIAQAVRLARTRRAERRAGAKNARSGIFRARALRRAQYVGMGTMQAWGRPHANRVGTDLGRKAWPWPPAIRVRLANISQHRVDPPALSARRVRG